ncbi:N-acetylmuramoyl-L-alanine amidase [Rothia nasimurium]|uniref:N-acetylmuramoyl-L-alanine amidase n=1 Tax=Rothia nasimurium TaxID=85336 RepID=A0A4Y9F1P1_9MICC|nr:peptidoglycan recognition family protein [Rothia nasimurium]MBF0809126.1 N-acetylmuramoyl-L-alanine amidase [Rothia nasimurium]TFU20648.1 N-acetylmuramoyl-L-alanine amidase [Rothia nasimurium]
MTTLKTGTVIDETTWNSPNYTPAAQVPAVFGRPRTTSRITIHHWGSDGQSFNGVADYLCRKGGTSSAHFVVEAGRVACLVSTVDAAWHSGSAEGNATSIGIECRPEMSEGDINEVVALIEWLEDMYGPQEVWLHREWSATACPGRYANMRDEIVNRVNLLQGTSGEAHAPAPATVDRVATIRAELAEIRESATAIEGAL